MPKKYRYGFKAEANRIASELREELAVSIDDPLCPWKLANHLFVPIIKLSELPNCAEKIYLTIGKGRQEFSATVCYEGTKSFIINNDAHPTKRQASDIAHELAHVLMGHPPTSPFDETGKRDFLVEIENEAEWLGPALLVSEQAALRAYQLIQSSQHTLSTLSDEWQITEDVIRMRMNAIGAAKRYKRKAA